MSYLTKPLTLQEIADGLSVVQRWNGETIVPWSVLQHSILCGILVGYTDPVRSLSALIHDAEEILVGDTPKYHKTPEQVVYGDNIRSEIFAGLKLTDPHEIMWKHIKEADLVAALAEAEVLVRPSKCRTVFAIEKPSFAMRERVNEATELVWDMIDMTRREAVETFLETAETLMATSQVRSLERRA